MKRKLAAGLLTAVVLVGGVWLAGNRVNVIYGLSEGVYAMQGDAGLAVPRVSFEMGDKSADYRFVLLADPLSSYAAVGTYTLKDGNAVLQTDDGENTYIFEVVDNDIIRFVQKGSAQIVDAAGENMVPDGAEFMFVDETNQ